jgi:hypothetical protein
MPLFYPLLAVAVVAVAARQTPVSSWRKKTRKHSEKVERGSRRAAVL